MGQLICELHRPGMTALHRVGLAGLYMTLDAFERDSDAKNQLSEAGTTWELDKYKVTLHFAEGKEQQAVSTLFDLAFQIDGGYFAFPGLKRRQPTTHEQKWILYQALMGTFLQHGKTRSVDKNKKGMLVFKVDDKSILVHDFAPVLSYNHQNAAQYFVNSQRSLAEYVKIAGPLYPGGAQRHTASGFGSTCLEEPAPLALCLLFAPVGAIYFHIVSRRYGRKVRAAVVVPPVTDLRSYANLRRIVAENGVIALTAASPTDAALRLTVIGKGQDLGESVDGAIRVMAFGTVSWSKQQKSRTAVFSVDARELTGLHNYELASAIFKNRWQTMAAKKDKKGNIKEPEHAFVRPCIAREIIADNVAKRKVWYSGFAEYMTNKEIRFSLQYERKELFQMTQDAEYEHPNEKVFIETCHEAWRRRLGQLSDRAHRENVSFQRLAGGEYEKLRSVLARCKNATSLRASLTDFWSRSGSLPSLQTGWAMILPLLEEDQWRKARDLALLSLASYQPANAEQKEAFTEPSISDEQGEEQ